MDNQVAEEKEETQEKEEAPPETLKEFLMPENTYEILQKRWVLFTLFCFVIYSYHFCMCIYGVDMFCHYTRFLTCGGKYHSATDYALNSAVLDSWILVVTIFHMIEWIRQWVFITTVLVGINWVSIYYVLSINIPYGLIVALISAIMGFTASTDCQENQPQRATFLKLQILTVCFYSMWCLMHVLVFVVANKMYPPDDKDKEDENKLKYSSWCQKQFLLEEGSDDD